MYAWRDTSRSALVLLGYCIFKIAQTVIQLSSINTGVGYLQMELSRLQYNQNVKVAYVYK